MFYQTIQVSDLPKAIAVNKKQDEAIYEKFKNGEAYDCWTLVDHFPYLVTSIRRSLNTLEKENKILKVGEIPGRMGKRVGQYRIKELKLF